MTKITYHDAPLGRITVKLDGRTVGTIRQHHPSGFYYWPTGAAPGHVFPTIDLVKRSLEADDDCIRLGDGTYCFSVDDLLDAIERQVPGSRADFANAFAHYQRAGLSLGEIFDRVQGISAEVQAKRA